MSYIHITFFYTTNKLNVFDIPLSKILITISTDILSKLKYKYMYNVHLFYPNKIIDDLAPSTKLFSDYGLVYPLSSTRH